MAWNTIWGPGDDFAIVSDPSFIQPYVSAMTERSLAFAIIGNPIGVAALPVVGADAVSTLGKWWEIQTKVYSYGHFFVKGSTSQALAGRYIIALSYVFGNCAISRSGTTVTLSLPTFPKPSYLGVAAERIQPFTAGVIVHVPAGLGTIPRPYLGYKTLSSVSPGSPTTPATVSYQIPAATPTHSVGATLSVRAAWPTANGWTRKFPREIWSLSNSGAAGQIARFTVRISSSWFGAEEDDPVFNSVVTTPLAERGLSGKLLRHNGATWVELPPTPGAEPDEVTAHGLIRAGDYVGHWIANETRDAINQCTVTVGREFNSAQDSTVMFPVIVGFYPQYAFFDFVVYDGQHGASSGQASSSYADAAAQYVLRLPQNLGGALFKRGSAEGDAISTSFWDLSGATLPLKYAGETIPAPGIARQMTGFFMCTRHDDAPGTGITYEYRSQGGPAERRFATIGASVIRSTFPPSNPYQLIGTPGFNVNQAPSAPVSPPGLNLVHVHECRPIASGMIFDYNVEGGFQYVGAGATPFPFTVKKTTRPPGPPAPSPTG